MSNSDPKPHLTHREAYDKMRANSQNNPAMLARVERLIAEGKINLEDGKPGLIGGGQWPTKIIGARRHNCANCNRYVALSPNSGMVYADMYPDVPILCYRCMMDRVEQIEKS